MKVLKFLQIVTVLGIVMGLASCGCPCQQKKEIKEMTYKVVKTNEQFNFNDSWQQGQWSQTDALELTHYMGDKPNHLPKTQAKVLYDDENIYVFFTVEDQYIRSVVNAHQGPVCRDSCVEFFFTPGENISQGYFNVEANCGGSILLSHQTLRDIEVQTVDVADINKMTIEHSMPQIVKPEIAEPTTWTLKYTLPLTILEKYAPSKKPAPGVKWKANFYKCGDDTSHPHWLTWSVVDKPQPDFHLPQYFGTIEFE